MINDQLFLHNLLFKIQRCRLLEVCHMKLNQLVYALYSLEKRMHIYYQ